MSLFSSLKREQKEAIGLLQIGTFLEYFDLMIYVHMAVLLNDLFFPKTDAHTTALLSAFAFCSTFVFRPFGALIIGWIGDNIGRKTTVIITTMMMALSCIIMANLPTYSQIGISAAWIVTLCRIIQGFSSIGEIIGAEIYITEITKPPKQYMLVSLVTVFSVFGTVIALSVASLVTSFGLSWRIAFWIGACIALIGSVARTRLRETPEFVDMKRKMKKAIEESSRDGLGKAAELLKSTNPIWGKKVNKKTTVSLFLIYCGYPVCFYFCYIYCANILKSQFAYTPEQIIHQNLLVSLLQLLTYFLVSLLSQKIHPLKILKIRSLIVLPLLLIVPYILSHATTPNSIFIIQLISVSLVLTEVPAASVFITHLPIFKRFTYTSFAYALARAIIYVITSFGLVYLTEWFGHSGLLIIMLPICISYLYGVHHFEKLEKQFETSTNAKEAGEKLMSSPAS
jgi:MFS family permease